MPLGQSKGYTRCSVTGQGPWFSTPRTLIRRLWGRRLTLAASTVFGSVRTLLGPSALDECEPEAAIHAQVGAGDAAVARSRHAHNRVVLHPQGQEAPDAAVSTDRVGLGLLSICPFVSYGINCLISPDMEREFLRYGFAILRVLTAWLEIFGGADLIAGLLWPFDFWVSSGGLSILMLGAVYTRVGTGDRIHLWMLALILLFLNTHPLVDSLRNED